MDVFLNCELRIGFLPSCPREKFLHLALDLVCIIILTAQSTDLKQSGSPTSDQTHVPVALCAITFLHHRSVPVTSGKQAWGSVLNHSLSPRSAVIKLNDLALGFQ